jgi:AP-3 complex subunit delta
MCNSEIAEPQKLLPHLLQPNVSLLSSETIGAYIQAAVKLFGAWSMELSQNWDNNKIRDVREVVDTLISRLKNLTSHSEAEVQERVRPIGASFKNIPQNMGTLGCQCSAAIQLRSCRSRIASSAGSGLDC